MSWIGVDLDGTLAKDTGWKGAEHIGAPIPAMVNRVKNWLDDGKEVRILTARVSGHPEAAEPIKKWCKQHLGQELDVTCEKDPEMEEIWDDKAVGVKHNKGTKAESIVDRLLEDLESKMSYLVKQFDLPEETIRRVADIDPTPEKTYISWLLRRYASGLVAEVADGPTLRDALLLFHNKKNRRGFVGSKDIMSYATVPDLLTMAAANQTDGMEVVRTHGDLQLRHVTTPDAARTLAIGLGKSFNERTTKWCTIALDMAAKYIKEGPLYVVVKGTASYAQVHFPPHTQLDSLLQVKNAENLGINEAMAAELVPLFDNLPDAVKAWESWGMARAEAIPGKKAFWRPNEVKRAKKLDAYRNIFISERWEGFSPPCKKCAGSGIFGKRRCPDCEGEGTLAYPPYTNPNCPQCKGTGRANEDTCPACLEVLNQQWLKRLPVVVAVLDNALERANATMDNSAPSVVKSIADHVPATPAYVPEGPHALYNALHPNTPTL